MGRLSSAAQNGTLSTPVTVPDDDYIEIFVVSLGDAPQLLLLHYAF